MTLTGSGIWLTGAAGPPAQRGPPRAKVTTMSEPPVVTEAAIQAGADAILTTQNASEGEPEQHEAELLARAALEAAAPHLAYAAGTAIGEAMQQQAARIAALEHLAAAMLREFYPAGDGHRARVGQVTIARWRKMLEGSTGG
jgi:hypothetical protein